MNRDQKAVAIAEIASNIDESDAIFAVDYRGITVAQVAELRAKLRESDATFKVVKNSLTERAADQVGAETLKEFPHRPHRPDVRPRRRRQRRQDRRRLRGAHPTAGVQGRAHGRRGARRRQIRSLSRLPSREVLYGQLVGIVASPVSGLVRTLNALLSGLAVALGQVQAKKESGEIPAGAAPASAAEAAAAEDAPGAAAERRAARGRGAAEATPEGEPAAEAEAADTD